MPSTSRNAAAKPKDQLSPVLEGEIDEVSDTPTPRVASGQRSKEQKSKKASKNDKGKAKAISVESEPDVEPDQRLAPKGKRRRKISSDDDEVEIEPHPVKKAKERKRGDVLDTKVKGRRGARQTEGEVTNRNSTDATANDVDSETEQAPAKKKRKININIFPKPAEPTFAFMVSYGCAGLCISHACQRVTILALDSIYPQPCPQLREQSVFLIVLLPLVS